MAPSPIAALLVSNTQPIPLYLTRFVAEVVFTQAYKGREDRATISDAFAELDALLKAGLFAWRHIEARAQSGIAIEWRDDGFTVIGRSAGFHHNLIVAVLRMIVSLHHTPADARAALVAALGEDAAALPPPSHWREELQEIRLADIEGIGTAARARFDAFEIDDEIIVPEGLTLDGDAPRLIVRATDGSPILDKPHLRAVENDFLAVCNTGAFRSLSQIDEMPEEGEFFLRPGENGPELVIDDYRDERYGLVEFLNAMTKGGNRDLIVG